MATNGDPGPVRLLALAMAVNEDQQQPTPALPPYVRQRRNASSTAPLRSAGGRGAGFRREPAPDGAFA